MGSDPYQPGMGVVPPAGVECDWEMTDLLGASRRRLAQLISTEEHRAGGPSLRKRKRAVRPGQDRAKFRLVGFFDLQGAA